MQRRRTLLEKNLNMKIVSFLKNKEAKNAGWLIAGKVVQMVLSLFVGIFTARYLGPGNYGLINYGMAYVTFFTALCNLGLNSVIIKDFIDYPEEQGEAIGSSILMRLVSSILSAITIVGIVCIVDAGEPTTIFVVALCSVGAIFHVFEIINYWFQAQYKSKITAIATLFAYIAMSMYKIVLLILEKNIFWFAFATSVDYIVIAVFLLLAYKKFNGPKLKFSFRKSKALLQSSYHYIFSSMMVAIYAQTDRLMLKQIIGDSEVGYYSTATAICSMWVFVLAAIIDSMYPSILRLYGKDEKAFDKKNRQLYAIVFYTSFVVSAVFLLLGDFIVELLYGAEYRPSVPVLKIATWYTAFSYLGVARGAWIVSEGKQKYLKYMNGAAVVVNVFLNLALIPAMGASGAALASLITQIATAILLPLCFREMRPNAVLMLEAICLRKIK